MESKDIHDLIDILSRSNVSELEIEQDGFKLRLVKNAAPPPAAVAPAPAPASAPAIAAPSPAAEAAPAAPSPGDGLLDQISPFVGTFYSAPTPDAEPFVRVGSKVQKGQVLCIVEAMKLMNEIESEHAGEVTEVLVQNGQPVEYGEVLFRIRP